MVKYFDSLDEAKAYLQNRGKLISCNSESSAILHQFRKYGLIFCSLCAEVLSLLCLKFHSYAYLIGKSLVLHLLEGPELRKHY